jgi:hypothetical protein
MLDLTYSEQVDVSDASAGDWTFLEDETGPALQSEPGADQIELADQADQIDPVDQIDSNVLMGFLSDFRSAVREKQMSERARQTARPAVGAYKDAVSRFEVGPADPEPWELDPYVGAERQVAPDWWIAADGRWYAPELHPDAQVTVEALHTAPSG